MLSIGFSRSRVTVTLMAAALLAPAPPARSGADWSDYLGPESLLDTGGIVQDVQTYSTVTFVANDAKVAIIDHSDASHPFQIGELPFPTNAVAYHPASARLVGGDATSVYLVDATNLASPVVLDTQPFANGAARLQFTGDGLFVIGISNQSVLRYQVVGNGLLDPQAAALPAAATALDVYGSIAAVGTTQGATTIEVPTLTFLGDILDGPVDDLGFQSNGLLATVGVSTTGIKLYNVTANPFHVGTIDPSATFFAMNEAQDGVVTAVDVQGNTRLYDASDVQNPTPLGTAKGLFGWFDASAEGRLVFGAGSKLYSVDATNQQRVPRLASRSLGALPISAALSPDGQVLHVVTASGTVTTFDVTVPANPQVLGTFPLPAVATKLTRVGQILYAATSSALYAVSYANPSAPFVQRIFSGSTGAVAGDGTTVVRGRTDASILEIIRNADNPPAATVQTISLPAIAQAVAVSGTELLAGVGSAGIWHIDFTGSLITMTYTGYPFVTDVDFLGAANTHAMWWSGLQSFAFDLGKSVEVGRSDWPAFLHDLYVRGGSVLRSSGAEPTYVYGTSLEGAVYVLDWTDPTDPIFVGEYSDPGVAPQFALPSADAVYVGDASAGGQLVVLPAHVAGGATAAPEVAVPAGSERILGAAWPNPFASSTQVPFAVARASAVDLSVHDVGGRLVRRLASSGFAAGEHVASWDGQDGSGRPAAAGVYFVRLEVGEETATRRIVRLR